MSENGQALHIVMKSDVDQRLDLDLVKDLARGLVRLAIRQPAETPVSSGSEAGSEGTLAVIRDYDAILSQAPGGTGAAKGPLEDLINPFAAARRGAFHGSLYEFHRNDNLDARNFFDPLGEPLPEYKRNQFGTNLSATSDSTASDYGKLRRPSHRARLNAALPCADRGDEGWRLRRVAAGVRADCASRSDHRRTMARESDSTRKDPSGFAKAPESLTRSESVGPGPKLRQ